MIQVARSPFAGGTRSQAGSTGAAPTRVRARYDNSLTTPENKRTWWAADNLSAKSANSFGVRRTLRMRSRYEVSNNPYMYGVLNSNADDLIDTGPTLQVRTSSAAFNRAVEKAWAEWCAEVNLTEKLRTCKLAKGVDGEGFLILKTVNDLESPVKLYPVDVEADQVTTSAPANLGELWVDGLTLHPVTGQPTHYHVLKHHPGDFYFPDMNPLAVEKIAKRHVIHWFQKFRPGQVRGVPVFTSSLDILGEMRAYRRAVIGAAELAADFAAVLEQDKEIGASGGDEDGDNEYQPFEKVAVNRKMMTMLPPGTRMSQFDAKQPTTSYADFQEKCLAEAFRPLGYPLSLALGSSQKFNFSSAKLDIVNYRNGLRVERDQCAREVLDALFKVWFEEAVLCGAVPVGQGLSVPVHEWHWPGFEALDPMVDAQTDSLRIAAGTDTLRDFWARRGKDWREMLGQLKAEADEIERLGLALGDVVKRSVTETTTETADTEHANAA